MRWTEEELATHLSRRRGNATGADPRGRRGKRGKREKREHAEHKFRARRKRNERGRTYDSTLEESRANELRQAQALGIVRELREQVRYVLSDTKGVPYRIRSTRYRNGRKVVYVADFVYEEQNEDGRWVEIIEDVKGYDTPTSRLKRAILERMVGAEIRIVHKVGIRSARHRKTPKDLDDLDMMQSPPRAHIMRGLAHSSSRADKPDKPDKLGKTEKTDKPTREMR